MIGRLLRRRPNGWFAIAAILATLAGLATLRAAAVDIPTTTVLVAAGDLSVGTRLARDDGAVDEVRVSADSVLPGMFRRTAELSGRVLAVPVAAGEPITESSLGGDPNRPPRPLDAGERAISVPSTTAGAAAAALVPGVRVDVVASPADGAGNARVVVAGAEVLTQTAPVDDRGGADGAVLLRVGATDALRLTSALDSAHGVRLLPRPIVESTNGSSP